MTGVERMVVRLMADATEYHKVFNAAESRLVTFVSAAVTLTAQAARAAITLAAEYRQTAVAFEVMLGSAEKGAAMMKDIQDFSIATPFNSAEVAQGAQKLLAMGVAADQVMPAMKALGEVVSGVGGDMDLMNRMTYNFSQVVSQGFASWVDIKQFAMAGVELKEFAKTAGMSVKELRNLSAYGGGIDANIVIGTFDRLTAEGGKFHNMMKRMSEEPLGQWNAFKESVTVILRDIGLQMWEGFKSSGIKDVVMEVLQAIKVNGPEIKQFFGDAFQNAKIAVSGIIFGVQEIYRIGKEILGVFGSMFEGPGISFLDVVTGIVMIPGHLEDAFRIIRSGILQAVLAITSVIEGVSATFIRMVKMAVDAANAVGITDMKSSDMVGEDPLVAFKEGLKQQISIDLNSLDAGERMGMRFHDHLKKAGKAAKDTGEFLNGIARLKMDQAFLPRDLMAFITGIQNEKAGRSPLEDFSRKMNALTRAFFVSDALHDEEGNITKREFGFGAAKIFEDLKNSVKDRLEQKLPTAMLRGSSEAQDTINKAQLQTKNIQQEILEVLQQAKIAEEETAKRAEEIRQALVEMQDKGLIKRGF